MGFSLAATSRVYSPVAVLGLLMSGASLVAEHGLLLLQSTGSSCCGAQALGLVGFSSCGSRALAHRLNSCGVRALLLCSMWDLPHSGVEPVSPALAGGFFTTEPPGKPSIEMFLKRLLKWQNG